MPLIVEILDLMLTYSCEMNHETIYVVAGRWSPPYNL